MKTKLLLLALALFAVSCSSDKTLSDAATEFNRSEAEISELLKASGHEISGNTINANAYEALSFAVVTDDIDKSEKALYGENNEFRFDEVKAQDCVAAYLAYCEKFGDREDAPDYMFKAADLLRALRKPGDALVYYEKICTDFPDYPKVPHSVFLQGFVYENDLADLDKAREKYEAFLEKYPEHDLADDVQFSLKYLGKSPEEIIKQFEDAPKDGEAEEGASEPEETEKAASDQKSS